MPEDKLRELSKELAALREPLEWSTIKTCTAKRVMRRVVQQSANWRFEEGGSHFTLTYAPPNRPPRAAERFDFEG
jgi:hypothetical protein